MPFVPGLQEDSSVVAPGMIPAECESLLQKSQVWGYIPGEKWKPRSLAQAVEVAEFFASYQAVPEATAQVYQHWLQEPVPGSEEEAQASLGRFSRAQSCDPFLAQTFLDGLIKFSWPRSEREKAGNSLLRFLLNQQARVAPLVTRAVSFQVLAEGRKHKLLSGSFVRARSLIQWLERERDKLSPAGPGALASWQALRKELELSNRAREKLSSELPLP
jgi:hypothetical protein